MESEIKHTQGPWKASIKNIPMADTGDYYASVCVNTDNEFSTDVICQCFDGGNISFEQQEANARLIAAAPELLKACEQALVAIRMTSGVDDVAYEVVETAIAKAKGLTQQQREFLSRPINLSYEKGLGKAEVK